VGTSTGSAINSNDVLYQVEYPNVTNGAAGTTSAYTETYDVDALGEITGYTDRDGTVHAYGLDDLGRETSDAISHFGTGVATNTSCLRYSFNSQGLPDQDTSRNGSTVVNQVRYGYNGLGQETDEWQALSGTVTTTGVTPTPEVLYAYSILTTGNLERTLYALCQDSPADEVGLHFFIHRPRGSR
jgi:YD repeat-containing protein